MIKNMKNTNLLKKGMNMILTIALVLCVCLTVLLSLFYNSMRNAVTSRIQNDHQRILLSVNTDMETMEHAIQNAAYSASLQALLADCGTAHPQLSNQSDVRDIFSQAFSYNRYIVGIAVYDENRHYVLSSGRAIILPDDLSEVWANIDHITWSGSKEMRREEDKYIRIFCPVYEKTAAKIIIKNCIGYLVFVVSTDWIQDVFADKGGEARIYLYDADENVICDYCAIKGVSGSNGNVCTTTIESTGWVLSSNLVNITIAADMQPMLILSICSAVMMLLLMMWMYRYYRNAISAPLNQIQDFMRDIPDIHARMNIPDKNQSNELIGMMNVLNRMLNTLDQKNEELLASKVNILEEESARQQMELIAYRNQVNPHFLYNTLDCIRGMALMYQAPKIVEMTQALSDMFHYTVKGDITATLAQEINNVKNYAKIMEARYTKPFALELPENEGFGSYLVIRNLLQPLVENAVLHGLDRMSDNGKISVDIDYLNEKKTQLRILVADNGKGMTEQQLRALNDGILVTRKKYSEVTTTSAHIGLQNIARRLFLHYGEQASIHIQSAALNGTVVEIVVPVVIVEEEES